MSDGYNLRGNKLANSLYDWLLAPEEKPTYDGPIPKKPAGLEELPSNVNMTTRHIKNLSELKRKTPQEQYEHNIQMKDPLSAYTRKEKEDLKNLIEVAKERGALKDDGANTMNISFDDADLASQTPAGEASAGDILPGGDGWVNQTDNPEGDGSGDGSMSVDEAMEIANKWAADGGWYANVMANGSEEDKAKAKMALNVINNSKKAPTKPPKPDDNSDGGDNSNGGAGGANGNKTKQEAKQESRYKLRSIMDAYNEGLLDEKSRDYLIVDTISKFVRNMGKDIGNIAAAYTGGTINNEREESIWSKRNEEMAKKAINAEGNKLRSEDPYDLDYQSQKLDLDKKNIKMVPAQNFQAAAAKMRKAGNETGAALMDLIAAASTESVDPEEYIAAAYANNPKVQKLVDSSIGSISNLAGILGDFTGYIEELLKSARGKAVDSANKSTGRRIADVAFGGNPLYEMATNYLDNKNK